MKKLNTLDKYMTVDEDLVGIRHEYLAGDQKLYKS